MLKKFSYKRQISIRFRIFIMMTSLLIIAFSAIAWITIPQFTNQSNKKSTTPLQGNKTQSFSLTKKVNNNCNFCG